MLPENILISEHLIPDLVNFLNQKKYSKLAVIVDENTLAHCLPLIQEALPLHEIIQVKSGEEQKNLQTCEVIWQRMTDMALDRHAGIIVIGGGVLGDMGGFCASTYKRGIDFILVPTTLLSQVDASVGGKLGVDFNHFKNHIGVFQQPALTLIYSGFLKTLPYTELRSGFAEVIKHCLISDAEMWNEISAHSLDDQDWGKLTRHSVEFKAHVTTEDPKEKGLRKTLNAGHTIGHAIESYLLGSGHRILHGEAIAIGLIAESYIAYERKMVTTSELNAISSFIIKIFGKIDLNKKQIEEAAAYSLQDKKNKANKILCVLPRGIGRSEWDQEISINDIIAGLGFYQSI